MQYTFSFELKIPSISETLQKQLDSINIVLSSQSKGGHMESPVGNPRQIRICLPKLSRRIIRFEVSTSQEELGQYRVIYNLFCSLPAWNIIHALQRNDEDSSATLKITFITDRQENAEFYEEVIKQFSVASQE